MPRGVCRVIPKQKVVLLYSAGQAEEVRVKSDQEEEIQLRQAAPSVLYIGGPRAQRQPEHGRPHTKYSDTSKHHTQHPGRTESRAL